MPEGPIVALEQSQQFRDYIDKFSIGPATWRPPRGRLTVRPEMDDMCNRVIREQATFPSIVRCIGGTSAAHSDGLKLLRNQHGTSEARSR